MRTMRVMSRDAPWRRATRGTGAEARRRATVRAPPGRARETTKARAKSERPDVDALRATELREVLREMSLPVTGKKAELVERVRKGWEAEDAGTTAKEAHAAEAEAAMLAERAAAEALSERRAMRRDRRGGGRANEARVGRRGAKKSIMETTREVERMKEAGESAVAREFVVQRAMSDSVSGEGWFMLETPEYREEQAREAIDLLNGTRLTRGQDDVVVWVPRVPNEEFYVKEEDAEGKSDLELCQMVDEENMLEMLQPGYVLVRCTLTQELMDAFDEMRCVRGFATGGSSRFGKKKYEKLNQPLTMDDQIPRMIAKCVPTVKTQADVERDEARAQARDVVAAERGNLVEDFADAGDMRPTSSREASVDDSERVEVHTGPFKGFKGVIVARNDDGSVEATLAIFGRDTNVSLAADEFSCI